MNIGRHELADIWFVISYERLPFIMVIIVKNNDDVEFLERMSKIQINIKIIYRKSWKAKLNFNNNNNNNNKMKV